MKKKRIIFVLLVFTSMLTGCGSDNADIISSDDVVKIEDPTEKSVARLWNEILLEAIRNDLARPTVHARNLFHISSAMFDAWAAFGLEATPYLLSNATGDCEFDGRSFSESNFAKREEAISFAAYRLIQHRFSSSPSATYILYESDNLMDELGYEKNHSTENYQAGDAAALGNYIASCYIAYGFDDGANEQNQYQNIFYSPVNPAIEPELPGNPNIANLNRWQVISLSRSIDQAGNVVDSAPEFLGPEWGAVLPFALSAEDKTIYERDGNSYSVYHDPGMPPQLSDAPESENTSALYQWNFSLVALWSSHLSAEATTTVDISPASFGNISLDDLPNELSRHPEFYAYEEGGDAGLGRSVNPVTGEPYAPQMVKLGDYARVLAEFWADGPDSETPPGHWFVLLNHVNDHPLFDRRLRGEGDALGPLEWDVKAYFTLGGAMHDSAIAAWGIKGWYDYIRPVSAIRAMAELGQSTDSAASNYHRHGLPLVAGYIETVQLGDVLAGANNEHVGKVKLYAWRGPDFIGNPDTDVAGVGWILAENWWPYQRPTFVTPPFAGYISGHSTYSRAAAEVLTALTGSEYFPGGMGEFEIKKNEFLVFEEGPSESFKLQWATYRDASDQCSLSRIWGGIHPPADDIPGRLIGEKIGRSAVAKALTFF